MSIFKKLVLTSFYAGLSIRFSIDLLTCPLTAAQIGLPLVFSIELLTGFSRGFQIGFSTELLRGFQRLGFNLESFQSQSASSSFYCRMLVPYILKIYFMTELFLRKVSSSIWRMAVRMLSFMTLLKLQRQLRSQLVGLGSCSELRMASLVCRSWTMRDISLMISALMMAYISEFGKHRLLCLMREMLYLRASFSMIEFLRSCFLALLRCEAALTANRQSLSRSRLQEPSQFFISFCSLFEGFSVGDALRTSAAGRELGDLGMLAFSINLEFTGCRKIFICGCEHIKIH